MDVNFWGALNHVYAFLPAMKEARSGHIVNISSGQAYFRLPTWGAYAAVKEGLGTFSEVLHYELERYGIDVTTVYPFMVNTEFYDGVKGDTLLGRLAMKLVPFYSMSPETVGRIIFKAVKRRRTVENVSILNDLAQYARSLPLVPGLIARVSTLMLARRRLEAA
jgi:short-subunit dehydrogenase